MLRHCAPHRRDPLSETALLGTYHAAGIENSPHYSWDGLVVRGVVRQGQGQDVLGADPSPRDETRGDDQALWSLRPLSTHQSSTKGHSVSLTRHQGG